jgi:Tfp pilus assembly protein PilV
MVLRHVERGFSPLPRGQRGFSPLPRGQRGFSPLPRGQRGFSLIEGLIGSMLFLLVVIGVLPLFVRAMMDNAAGADYTKVANLAKSGNEDFSRAWFDLNNPNPASYAVPSGSTSNVIDRYLDPVTNTWQPWPPPASVAAQWRRTTTVTKYAFEDYAQNGTFTFKLDGALKSDVLQTQVQVQNVTPTGPLGARRQTILRFMKSF